MRDRPFGLVTSAPGPPRRGGGTHDDLFAAGPRGGPMTVRNVETQRGFRVAAVVEAQLVQTDAGPLTIWSREAWGGPALRAPGRGRRGRVKDVIRYYLLICFLKHQMQ